MTDLAGRPIPIVYGTARIRAEVLTMAIDPKKIEEWEALIEERRRDDEECPGLYASEGDSKAYALADAVPALLAEREELLVALDGAKTEAERTLSRARNAEAREEALGAEREEMLMEIEQRNRFALESDAAIEKLKGTVWRLLGEADVARREREEMLAVLRDVTDHFLDEHSEACPMCHEGGGYAGPEHAPSCRLAHLLKG